MIDHIVMHGSMRMQGCGRPPMAPNNNQDKLELIYGIVVRPNEMFSQTYDNELQCEANSSIKQ
jgi:hypothetical protein